MGEPRLKVVSPELVAALLLHAYIAGAAYNLLRMSRVQPGDG